MSKLTQIAKEQVTMIGNRSERRLLLKLNTRTLKKEYKSLSIQDKQAILKE